MHSPIWQNPNQSALYLGMNTRFLKEINQIPYDSGTFCVRGHWLGFDFWSNPCESQTVFSTTCMKRPIWVFMNLVTYERLYRTFFTIHGQRCDSSTDSKYVWILRNICRIVTDIAKVLLTFVGFRRFSHQPIHQLLCATGWFQHPSRRNLQPFLLVHSLRCRRKASDGEQNETYPDTLRNFSCYEQIPQHANTVESDINTKNEWWLVFSGLTRNSIVNGYLSLSLYEIGHEPGKSQTQHAYETKPIAGHNSKFNNGAVFLLLSVFL